MIHLLTSTMAVILTALIWSLLRDLSSHGDRKKPGGKLRADGVTAAAVFAVMLGLHGWQLDRGDSEESREALYRPVATAIAEVALDGRTAAWLITQALHETRFARYVLENRCEDGPVGARCDEGRARGPWQVHGWCVGAWDSQASQAEQLEAGARCALRGYWQGLHWCDGDVAGAFAAQHSALRFQDPERWCRQPWALMRVRTMRDVEVRLWAAQEARM